MNNVICGLDRRCPSSRQNYPRILGRARDSPALNRPQRESRCGRRGAERGSAGSGRARAGPGDWPGKAVAWSGGLHGLFRHSIPGGFAKARQARKPHEKPALWEYGRISGLGARRGGRAPPGMDNDGTGCWGQNNFQDIFLDNRCGETDWPVFARFMSGPSTSATWRTSTGGRRGPTIWPGDVQQGSPTQCWFRPASTGQAGGRGFRRRIWSAAFGQHLVGDLPR